MKKAEILQDLAVYMRDRVDNGFDITITDAEARALVEALESLRWVNIYSSAPTTDFAKTEWKTIDEALRAGETSNLNYIETAGIIRLKDSH